MHPRNPRLAAPADTAEVLLQAVELARLAPSIHNTQPWRFAVSDDGVDVLADPDRRLTVLDPRGRQLLISCGCALFHLRVGIAAAGYRPLVTYHPDAYRPDAVAHVAVGDARHWDPVAPLAAWVARRRTNRRAFLDLTVDPEDISDLVERAACESVELVPLGTADARLTAARLSTLADRREGEDEAYRAELAAWTTDDPRRRDGVQAASVPFGEGAPCDDLPIRRFDTHAMGWLPASTESTAEQCLLLFTTRDDGPTAWLHTGEALEHVWLQLTRRGYSASPLTQVVEVRETHERLRRELRLPGHPQLLLRVGRAAEVVPTRRRDLRDLLT